LCFSRSNYSFRNFFWILTCAFVRELGSEIKTLENQWLNWMNKEINVWCVCLASVTHTPTREECHLVVAACSKLQWRSSLMLWKSSRLGLSSMVLHGGKSDSNNPFFSSFFSRFIFFFHIEFHVWSIKISKKASIFQNINLDNLFFNCYF